MIGKIDLTLTHSDRGALLKVLERSKSLGFLGPGPVEAHLDHALSYRAILSAQGVQGTVADLGSGGGVPGLVLARSFSDLKYVLIDGMEKRCSFLESAVAELELKNTTVVCGRAEEIGRRSNFRDQFGAVVARSFGAPAVLAECAAPLLTEGGLLLVSEPPLEDEGRWPETGLTLVGLRFDRRLDEGGKSFALIHKVEATDSRWPRRTGVPSKRPLF